MLRSLFDAHAAHVPQTRNVLRGLLAAALFCTVAPPASAQPGGRKVAFVVGVGDFKHDLRSLDGSPQKDAAAVADVLKAGGFEVVVLTDRDATREKIEKRFKAVLDGDGNAAKALGKDDLLLVHICTHGFTLPPEPGKKDEPYLAAHDSRTERPETMVALNGLIRDAKSFGPTAVFLVDACRELADPNRGTRGIEGAQVSLPKGVAVLFSCGRGQVSHQSDKADGHGLFTFAVLKVLRGQTTLKDKVTWTGLVFEVENAFRSTEFQKMIPAGKPQRPVAAAGEMDYTELMSVAPGNPPKKDDTGVMAKAPPKKPADEVAKKNPPKKDGSGEMAKKDPPGPAPAGVPDLRDYYPLTQGSEWVYNSNGTRVVMRVEGTDNFDGHEWAVLKTYSNGQLVATEAVRIDKQRVLRGRINQNAVTPPVVFLSADGWANGSNSWNIDSQVGGQRVKGPHRATTARQGVAGLPRDVILVTSDADVAGTPTQIATTYAKGVGAARVEYTIAGNTTLMTLESFTVKP